MEALPKCVYFKHGSYYLVKQGKWHFLTKDVDQISNQLQLRFGFADGKVPYGWKEPMVRSALETHLLSVLGRARQNAKGRKIKEFEIDQDYVLGLLKECGYRCSVTNTPFSLEVISHDGRKPFAPSIDRIDSAAGYVEGNCRIVCLAANIAMNTWGDSILLTMLKYARKRPSIGQCQIL